MFFQKYLLKTFDRLCSIVKVVTMSVRNIKTAACQNPSLPTWRAQTLTVTK
jgi:hypothetical protein